MSINSVQSSVYRSSSSSFVRNGVSPEPDFDAEIIDFYGRGSGIPRGDCRGMGHLNFLRLDPKGDYTFLESRHEYIQWLFPTTERSQAVPDSPYYRSEVYTQWSTDMRANLRESADLMSRFYEVQEPTSHNFSRITRIITSLKLHGLHDEAGKFHTQLTKLEWYPRVPQESINFWKQALGDESLPQQQSSSSSSSAGNGRHIRWGLNQINILTSLSSIDSSTTSSNTSGRVGAHPPPRSFLGGLMQRISHFVGSIWGAVTGFFYGVYRSVFRWGQ